MKHAKLFIWDFDGTLLDTYPFITMCLKNALMDCGYEVAQTEILEKMMVTISFAIGYYSDKYQISDLRERYRGYYAGEAESPVRTFPGVKDVLKRIQEMGAANNVIKLKG